MHELTSLKGAICSLFEVHSDEGGVQRIVTPLEYSGSGDRVVVRVRPRRTGFSIDENGEAAMHASMSGGDIESDVVVRWAEGLSGHSPARIDEHETIFAFTADESLIAPYIFRVAEAAQQLHAIATSRADRRHSEFKTQLAVAVAEVARSLSLDVESDVELPISGGMIADHLIKAKVPLIVIAATGPTRLLEAQVIHMQYQIDGKPGFVLAVAESQIAVGQKQFERAGYYTDRTVVYNKSDLERLIAKQTGTAPLPH